jgi:hypothetical protein
MIEEAYLFEISRVGGAVIFALFFWCYVLLPVLKFLSRDKV